MTHQERAIAVQQRTDGCTSSVRVSVLADEFAAIENAALERAAKECGSAEQGWAPGYEAGPRIRALATGGG